MENQSKLEQDLHEWLTERMRFHPQGRFSGSRIPGPEELKFVCRGQMIDIWQHIIDHVHPASSVTKVKGNLMLQKSKPVLSGYKVSYKSDSSFNHERETLLEQRQKLSAELSATTEAIGELKRDLSSTREEIVSAEQKYQLKKSRIRDVERKTALLRAAAQHASSETAKLNECLSLITEKADRFQNLTKQNPEYVPMFAREGFVVDGKERALESADVKDVRESCDLIGSFLGRVIHGSFADDRNELERNNSDLWQNVGHLLTVYSPDQIMSALCDCTKDTAQRLDETTAAIDIRKDAEKLRFKYEKGGRLSDVSCPKDVLQTVRQLLEESQEATFSRFVATEESLNKSWKLRPMFTQLSEKVQKILTENHRGNPGALELAKSLYQTELRVFTSTARVRLLTEISDDLKENIGQLSARKRKLFAKHQKIQDFRRIADEKQDLIRDLIRQNMESRIKLQKDQLELLKYTENFSASPNADVRQMTRQLVDCVSKETEAFTMLDFPYLLLTTLENGDKVAVVNLSINRLRNDSKVVGCQTIQKLAKDFQFPRFKASEFFVQHIVSLMIELWDTSIQLRSFDRTSSLAADCRHKLKIDVLCEEVTKMDSNQLKQLIPPLQKRLNDATRCLADCLQVKDIVVSWWEQPGQACTPWVTVDGLNLQQWKGKWTVASTQMRHRTQSAS